MRPKGIPEFQAQAVTSHGPLSHTSSLMFFNVGYARILNKTKLIFEVL
jgi:hypothetical protein